MTTPNQISPDHPSVRPYEQALLTARAVDAQDSADRIIQEGLANLDTQVHPAYEQASYPPAKLKGTTAVTRAASYRDIAKHVRRADIAAAEHAQETRLANYVNDEAHRAQLDAEHIRTGLAGLGSEDHRNTEARRAAARKV